MAATTVTNTETRVVLYTPPSATTTDTSETRPVPSKFKRVMKKIWRVVKVILQVLISVAAFVGNPFLFTIGLIVGAVIPKHVQNGIDKIKLICKKMCWAPILIVGASLFLAPHATWIVGSVFMGAAAGKALYSIARKKASKGTAPAPSPTA